MSEETKIGVCPYCEHDIWFPNQEYSNTDEKGRPWHDRCVREWCGTFGTPS